jgi:hypothetical protein
MRKRAREDAGETELGGAFDGDGEGMFADELTVREIERARTVLDGCV